MNIICRFQTQNDSLQRAVLESVDKMNVVFTFIFDRSYQSFLNIPESFMLKLMNQRVVLFIPIFYGYQLITVFIFLRIFTQ